MKKKTMVILAAAAVLAVGGVFVIAQRAMHRGFGGHGMGPGGGRGAMMFLKALDLTQDQQAKVKEILDANKGTMQPIREQAGTFADSIKLWSGA